MAFDMKDRLGQLKHVVSRITATAYTIESHTVVCPFEYHPIPNRTIAWGRPAVYYASILTGRPLHNLIINYVFTIHVVC